MMYALRAILTLSLLIGGIWFVGFLWFVQQVDSLRPPEEPKAQGIVVLTGGGGRVEEGLELLAAGRGKKLLISGVHRDVVKEDLLKVSNLDRPFNDTLLSCCVALGYEAGSTYGNALEAASWAGREKFTALIVVTAHYHLPRALLEFHRAMPDVQLVPYPLTRENVAAGRWWSAPATAKLLMVEYTKYGGALLRSTIHLLKGQE